MRWLAGLLTLCIAGYAWASDLPIKPEARALWKESLDFYRANDPARALEVFLKAYHADPAVLSLNVEGMLDALATHLKNQLATNPSDVTHNFRLGELMNILGNLPEAVQYYRAVVRLSPHSPMAQLANDEANKLEGFLRPVPTPVASASPAPTPEEKAKREAAERAEEAQRQYRDMEDALKKSKEENALLKDELEKQKEEYEKLKVEYEKAKYYQTLYFANPANVNLLKNGQIK
jgi:hypothetical protein